MTEAKKARTAAEVPALPEFWSRGFLLKHVADIVAFYEGRAQDPAGGFHQNMYLDGTRYNEGWQQIVSTARYTVNFCHVAKVLDRPELLALGRHGLAWLEEGHWVAEKEMYAFTLQDHKPLDMTQHAYAYAFVLMAHAATFKAGVAKDASGMAKVYDLLERRFWQPEHQAYADTMSEQGELDSYRGQNSNMHLCEALLAAYESCGEERYLKRAEVLAKTYTQALAGKAKGLVWEHYTPSFEVDWEYNKDDPANMYRPWGFQPGHQIEWAKNLLNLRRHLPVQPDDWMLKRAQELFDVSYDTSWDKEHGGLVYGFNPEMQWCDSDKYFWVQAESIATAALLVAAEAGSEGQAEAARRHRQCYDALWAYCWQHFVDHTFGGWFQKLTVDNKRYTNEKVTSGFKCDYHTIMSCIEALRAFNPAA